MKNNPDDDRQIRPSNIPTMITIRKPQRFNFALALDALLVAGLVMACSLNGLLCLHVFGRF